ncbi:MAG: hypothetical protein OXC05_02985 [Halieaceae bacterium]|nr:hypothetical protein [Halieaceae bacterium]
MNASLQRFCAFGGPIFGLLFLSGMLVAGILPPTSPDLSSEQVSQLFQDNQLRILMGSVFMLLGSPFPALQSAAGYCQLSRMEGPRNVCSTGQLVCGALNTVAVFLPATFFALAAFRPDRNPDALLALYDLAWITTLYLWTPGALMVLCQALVIIRYGTDSSPYPRWLGFLAAWFAVLMATSTVVIFFKTGPFAWDGLFGFWIPTILATGWFWTFWWMTRRAINTEESEAAATAC